MPPVEKHPDHLLNSHEAADMLGVEVSWVKNHCTHVQPLLTYVQLGIGKNAKRRFRREDIIQFIDENTRHLRLPRRRQ
jgi:hypothetical protein